MAHVWLLLLSLLMPAAADYGATDYGATDYDSRIIGFFAFGACVWLAYQVAKVIVFAVLWRPRGYSYEEPKVWSLTFLQMVDHFARIGPKGYAALATQENAGNKHLGIYDASQWGAEYRKYSPAQHAAKKFQSEMNKVFAKEKLNFRCMIYEPD